MDHSLKVQAELCPAEPWKERDFFFFFFFESICNGAFDGLLFLCL